MDFGKQISICFKFFRMILLMATPVFLSTAIFKKNGFFKMYFNKDESMMFLFGRIIANEDKTTKSFSKSTNETFPTVPSFEKRRSPGLGLQPFFNNA